MIRGIGTDVASVEDVRAAIERSPRLPDALFDPDEVAACRAAADPWPAFAAAFAAKEAVLKAIGAGLLDGGDFRDVVVAAIRPDGTPRVTLLGLAAGRAAGAHVRLSVSHAGGIALAVAILEDD
jgi:holo-[acyl-carrier protein] synthase